MRPSHCGLICCRRRPPKPAQLRPGTATAHTQAHTHTHAYSHIQRIPRQTELALNGVNKFISHRSPRQMNDVTTLTGNTGSHSSSSNHRGSSSSHRQQQQQLPAPSAIRHPSWSSLSQATPAGIRPTAAAATALPVCASFRLRLLLSSSRQHLQRIHPPALPSACPPALASCCCVYITWPCRWRCLPLRRGADSQHACGALHSDLAMLEGTTR